MLNEMKHLVSELIATIGTKIYSANKILRLHYVPLRTINIGDLSFPAESIEFLFGADELDRAVI